MLFVRTMAGNCFFDLPPEIRNEIYFEYLDAYKGGVVTPRLSKARLLFGIGRDHCADASSDALMDYVDEGQHAQECSTAPALLLASKQNYQEAVPIFLHSQILYVADLTIFSAWLSAKPTSHWQAIRHVILGQSIADVHVMRGDRLTTVQGKHQAKDVVKLASTLPSLVTLGVETAAVMSYKFRLPWLRQGFRSLQKISITRVPGAAVVHLETSNPNLSAAELWWNRVSSQIQALDERAVATAFERHGRMLQRWLDHRNSLQHKRRHCDFQH
ncbi:hypothetical protein LTR17_005455 [Elasticomyces elasticus]|nr:hypothetical protein LTR17_005455 [Elasticomyces elasticus]